MHASQLSYASNTSLIFPFWSSYTSRVAEKLYYSNRMFTNHRGHLRSYSENQLAPSYSLHRKFLSDPCVGRSIQEERTGVKNPKTNYVFHPFAHCVVLHNPLSAGVGRAGEEIHE